MPTNIDSHAISLGSLLTSENCCLKVPPFQRDYSWTKVEVEQLWNDIVSTLEENRTEHFMGAIVVNSSENPESLIDGQQRLATISLLLCAIRDLAKESGDTKLSTKISERYLGSESLWEDEIEPKLILNETNDQFYRGNIIEGEGFKAISSLLKGRSIDKSNRLLLSAYVQLYNNLKQRSSKIGDLGITLKQITECIQNRLTIINIAVADEANAYLIFETLNDRGLELSVADLLKNYLFSRSDNRISEVKKKWEEINRSIKRFDIKKFIRHYWLSHEGIIREKELYQGLRSKIRSQSDVINFVNQLHKSAEIYGALADPQSVYWGRYDQKFRDDLEKLLTFKVNLCYPILLTTAESLPEDFLPKVLRMLVVFSFRYNTICELSPTTLEKHYSETAIFIRRQKPKSVKRIFEKLSKIYPGDKQFQKSFASKSFSKSSNRLARNVLIELNNYRQESKELITNPNSSELNLEHILPQRPDQVWSSLYSESEIEDYIYRLGNMTLLESSSNRNLGNLSFDDKCESAYRHSRLEITRGILEYPIWGPEQIRERQEDMAKDAVHIWRLDY